MILSILLFAAITFGLGSISFLAGFSKENFFEKFTVAFGLGLALIPFSGVIFNLLSIPLDYRFFLLLAAIFTALTFFCRKKNREKKLSSAPTRIIRWQDLGVIIIFSLSLFMYLRGSLSFPWLGSDDPYRFLSAAKYIATEKTYTITFQFNTTTQPYPQGYQILLAILSQINQSLNWTAKFFTSFIAASSLLFFYCLANKLLRGKTAAFLATAALASMPAWLTHYIYSLNFNMALLPLFLYSLEKTNKNRKWITISALVFASIWFIHFYTSFVITLLAGVYYLAKVLSQNNLQKRIIASIALGLFFSLFFWIPSCLIQFPGQWPGGSSQVISLLSRFTRPKFVTGIIFSLFIIFAGLLAVSRFWMPKLINFFRKHKLKRAKPLFFYLSITLALLLLLIPERIMPVLGSGSIPYSWSHFFAFRLESNLIQSPFGIGPLSFILAIIAFIFLILKSCRLFTKPFAGQAIIFLLAIFGFMGVNSGHFSLNLMPFRMWAFLAFSAALLNGLFYKELIAKKIKIKWKKALIFLAIITLFIPSWYQNKYRLNAGIWMDNFLHVIQSQNFYAWLKDNFPRNSKVYSLGVSQAIPIAFDMLSFIWDEEVKNYKNKDVEADPLDNYHFLKEKGYEYIVIDYPSVFSYTFNRGRLYRDRPEEERERLSLERANLAVLKKEVMIVSDKFQLVKEFENGAIFKLK